MNRTEHLLVCLAEECAELAKDVAKALRFGLDDKEPGQDNSNRARICNEMRDVLAVYAILESEGTLLPAYPSIGVKLAKIERFMEIARANGVLSPNPSRQESAGREG